mgnify:CR=1 FL=1
MTSSTKRFIAAALFAGAGLVPALAAEVEGVKLPGTVRAAAGGPELVLNGAGVRTRVFFKVYVGALYLQKKTGDAKAVLSDAGAKRVAKLDPQVMQLEGIFNAVKAVKTGDTILLDFAPGTGTRVTVNGESRGVIPGEEFSRALLRVWLGDQPADAALKKAMLGG